MIGYLRGKIQERGEDHLILDVAGVGYELSCSVNTIDDSLVLEQNGGELQLFVHTQLREDSLTLFGFSTQVEKRMFLSLLKVNGVGAKMAIKILSATRMDHLTNMIEAGDVSALSKLPKVGKKTAEQLILTLKGKLILIPTEMAQDKATSKKSQLPPPSRFTGTRAEILSALVNLGFRLQEAEQVVLTLPEEIDLQTGIRQGLQAMSGSF